MLYLLLILKHLSLGVGFEVKDSFRIIFQSILIYRDSPEFLLSRMQRAQQFPKIQRDNLNLRRYLQALLQLPAILTLDILKINALRLLDQDVADLAGTQRICFLSLEIRRLSLLISSANRRLILL